MATAPDVTTNKQDEVNVASYRRSSLVGGYQSWRSLEPSESLLLLQHHERLAGRVVELGCGGGRITRHLLELSTDLIGLDVSTGMIEACRRELPQGRFEVADMRDLRQFVTEPVDAVVAGFNVIDVIDHADRMKLLETISDVLVPGGLLILSSHNLASTSAIKGPAHVFSRQPRKLAGNIVRLPRRIGNHRRLKPLEQTGSGYAVRNDDAHDYSLLHYYVSPREQERQLEQVGMKLLECVTRDGTRIGFDESVPGSHWLYYAAVRPLQP